jgi:hypothetical protein
MSVNLSGVNTMDHLWREGAFLSALWESRLRGLSFSLSQPGTREWWSEWGKTFDDDFRIFVDDVIREGEAAA